VDIMANPWDQRQHIERLAFLPALVPGPAPPGPVPHPEEEPEQFLMFFRQHARAFCDAELLDDRETIWQNEMGSLEDLPTWMTLTPDKELKVWKDILLDDLGVDGRALQPFVALVRRGHHGNQEGCRILAHLLKDKDLSSQGHRTSNNASSWMHRAATECHEALDDPQFWEQGPGAQHGPYKGSGKGASDPSSSSATWGSYQPGAQHGPSKGSGKGASDPSTSASSSSWGRARATSGFQQGFR